MKKLIFWKKNISKQDVSKIENLLSSKFKPIKPRKGFAEALRIDLVGTKEAALIDVRNEKIKKGLVIAAAVSGGLMLLITGIRAMAAVLGALGLFQQMKKQSQEQKSTNSNLAF